jgi:hypothetical protein
VVYGKPYRDPAMAGPDAHVGRHGVRAAPAPGPRQGGTTHQIIRRPFLAAEGRRSRSLSTAERWRVPMANEWQTIKKAKSGVRIWPSYLL